MSLLIFDPTLYNRAMALNRDTETPHRTYSDAKSYEELIFDTFKIIWDVFHPEKWIEFNKIISKRGCCFKLDANQLIGKLLPQISSLGSTFHFSEHFRREGRLKWFWKCQKWIPRKILRRSRSYGVSLSPDSTPSLDYIGWGQKSRLNVEIDPHLMKWALPV